MGTDKRERQKAGRQLRVEAAHEAAKRADRRRRVLFAGGIVAFVAIVAGGVLLLVRREDTTSSSTATSPSTTAARPAVGSAAGKPCVPLADPLPAGAPTVPITAGPPPTELTTQDLKVGDGATVPTGAPSTKVTVQYIGVSCSTGKIFDSSWSRNQPATFALSGVIPGWTNGIPGMQVGGQRLLVIPPGDGYGAQGSPPKIAPDETLYFVVDLVSIEGTPATTAAGG